MEDDTSPEKNDFESSFVKVAELEENLEAEATSEIFKSSQSDDDCRMIPK